MYTYPIDYTEFSNAEIIILVEFLAMIEDANTSKVNPNILLKKYNQYRKIINSVSLEKKLDRDFEKASGFSVYKTMKPYL
jgi:uncharacterized protein YktA (UPF0223 family)